MRVDGHNIGIAVRDKAVRSRGYSDEPEIVLTHPELCSPAVMSIDTARALKRALERALRRAAIR